MPIANYPFQSEGPFSEPAPILPLIIINPDNGYEYDTWGLVDTGADASVIPGHIAEYLGHNIEKGKYRPGYTGGGSTDVYEHKFIIEVLEMEEDGFVNDNVVVSIPNKGKYIGVMRNCPYVLLGVKDFLKKYVLIIDYQKQFFSIRTDPNKPPKKKRVRSSP